MGEEGGGVVEEQWEEGGGVVEERWEHPGEVSTTVTKTPPVLCSGQGGQYSIVAIVTPTPPRALENLLKN